MSSRRGTGQPDRGAQRRSGLSHRRQGGGGDHPVPERRTGRARLGSDRGEPGRYTGARFAGKGVHAGAAVRGQGVTPAGRYTVGEAPDNLFGITLNVNEIQGSDWDIAIHKIFLGFPLEHRDARLASMNGRDKHITFGCIDVSAPVMRRILASVPNEDGTPLYIVPTDERRIEAFFPPLSPAARVAAAGELTGSDEVWHLVFIPRGMTASATNAAPSQGNPPVPASRTSPSRSCRAHAFPRWPGSETMTRSSHDSTPRPSVRFPADCVHRRRS